ncbi:MAG: ABC transporter permease [Acetobacteraceae bacterium]|nr:ABC transporter permease [Acetobacteraceae bacterium]
MRSYLIKRMMQAVAVVFIITVVTFAIVNLAPGGPSILVSMESTAEEREALKAKLGLGQPLPVRYWKWMNALLHGDLGRSFSDGRPVAEAIGQRLPNTLLLGGAALALSVALALPAGVVSATRRYSLCDYLVTLFSFLGLSVPAFWFAIVLILLFSVRLHWLPSSGMATVGLGFSLFDRVAHLVMPAVVLSTVTMPQIVRFTRSSLLEVLGQDYVRTARAKGVPERGVVYRHALRNALIPVVTVIGLLLPALVGGAVITETVFGWPGMGSLALAAAVGRDYPMVMGVTLVVGTVVVLANLGVDLAYGLLDPRIRYE